MAMKNKMGLMAGQIWTLLSTDGPQTTIQIRKKLNAKANLIDFALGWLAREDKVVFTEEKRSLKISLR